MRPANPETVNSAKKTPTGMRFVMEGERTGLRIAPVEARSVPLDGKSGDPREIHLVDLLGIEELPRVAQVDAIRHEDVKQVRVDVAVLLELAEDGEGFRQRLAGLVGPVLGGEGLE